MLNSCRLKFFLTTLFLIQIFIFHADDVVAENRKIFKTIYTDIFYSENRTLSDFFWRISGKRFDFLEDLNPARSRVDRIVNRVQSILDMQPDNFHIKINLFAQYEEGMIALYSYKTNSIIVYADKVTDGIFAHEIAHAVICNYFPEPLPSKIQEILAQYVDRHLWTDYS